VRKLEGFFEVSYDSSRKLIRITTYGFWNLQVVEQFAQAIADIGRIAEDGCDTLLNTCRTEIHTLEVSEALGRISYGNKDAKPGRIAIVSPSMLLRMQTKRIQPADGNFGYFDTEQEALQWLAAA
jgi:hypothetical protein